MVLRKIGVFSLGKVLGVLYAMFGLIAGVIISLFALVGGAAGAASSGEAGQVLVGLLLGVGAVIILPIFYGAIGFVGGIIAAALYNFTAGLVGGVELQLE